MTDDRDDLDAILAKHAEPGNVGRSTFDECVCGWRGVDYRAHVAQMVLESDWMANAKAEVWVECLQAVSWAVDRGTAEQAIGYVLTNNPYDRADRVDAEDGGR